MLKFSILAASALWLYSFFRPPDSRGTCRSGGFIYLLSIAIIVMIIIGFLS